MASLENQFRAKIGEVAYTSYQVFTVLHNMKLDHYIGSSEDKIRKYVRKNKLFVNLDKLGIKSEEESQTKYWIPKSKLVDLIEGLKIPVNLREFEDAAYKLGYQI